MSHIHVIGAGLAGLACAVRLAGSGHRVSVYEAAARAGGRCRSFHDEKLGCVIDNGNHLMLSGNHALMDYLDEINASNRLVGPDQAAFDFYDVPSGERWTLRLDDGLVQSWILKESRRVPGTRLSEYLSFIKMMTARGERHITDVLDTGSELYRRFWEPLVVSALNTAPECAAVSLLRPVLRETFLKGGAYCRPLIAGTSLDDSLVEPALAFLQHKGVEFRFHSRITALEKTGGRIAAIKLGEQNIRMDSDDKIVLAVPSWTARQLLPGFQTPDEGEAIVNVHYRLDHASHQSRESQGPMKMIGLVGGLVHWVFERGSIVSVTISAADKVAQRRADDIAAEAWAEVAKSMNYGDMRMPPFRVIKEKRATFSATPDANHRRTGPKTDWSNLALAGDWTDTGLPATIEGAIRSGHAAAAYLAGTIKENRDGLALYGNSETEAERMMT